MDNNTNILKHRNSYKDNKKRFKMGFGEYASFLTFGIISTGAIALHPQQLPLLILGAFIISLMLSKLYNLMVLQIGKSSVNFLIFALVGGIIAFIGMMVIMKEGLLFKINGTIWLFMSVLIMKYNVDNLLR